MTYLAAVLAGIPVFSWVAMLVLAALGGISMLVSTTFGLKVPGFVALGVVLLAVILAVGIGLVAAVATGRWVRARLLRGSLLIALLWILLLFLFVSVGPAPFVYVLE
jgi:hypothetical protein